MKAPTAVYRFQFNPSFQFGQASGLVPYLRSLGISHLYASPLTAARSGSQHGYDVTDFSTLNPQLGSWDEFEQLTTALQDQGMGLLLDIVPNHMAVSPQNPWWADVLENGPESRYAPYFDIDWEPAYITLHRRILLPVLGNPYGRSLENGELQLRYQEGRFLLDYHGLQLPLNLTSVQEIFRRQVTELAARQKDGELEHRIVDLERQLHESAGSPRDTDLRARVRDQFRRLSATHSEFRRALDSVLERLNGRKGDPSSFDAWHELLEGQHYRLVFWRKAREESNYRRFFNISDLVGTRVESPEVFADIHRLFLRLIQEGRVQGLRIDHIDGLHDPLAYLQRLQSEMPPASILEKAAPGHARGGYVVVEKILALDEELPREWPVCGTTGYDFMARLNGLMVDPRGLETLGRIYSGFTGMADHPELLMYQKKKDVITHLFPGETRSLYEALKRIADADRHGRDLPGRDLNQALIEITACLPVYRTYIRDNKVSSRDRKFLEIALRNAGRRNPSLTSALLTFMRRLLILELDQVPQRRHEDWRSFVLRWQQYTGPVTAKGIEDTAFYVYNRLVSLNEVGGEPEQGAIEPADFHRYNRGKAEKWPLGLNATSTHDTKRSEDVRARLHALSELAEEWQDHLLKWRDWNQGHKRRAENRLVPDPNEEMLIYQTMLGAWPLDSGEVDAFRERLKAYVVKAAREAKENTRWSRPNRAHEKALESFVDALFLATESPFQEDLQSLQKRIAFLGCLNSLSQTVLKIFSPGVPDFYQGCELWDFSLVDPDNRRPVDYRRRTTLLQQIQGDFARSSRLGRTLLGDWRDGRVKLFLIWRCLELRKRLEALVAASEYEPLQAAGSHSDHVFAFLRRTPSDHLLVVVPLRASRLSPPFEFPLGEKAWLDTRLILPPGAPGAWTDGLDGTPRSLSERPLVGTLLADFPCAVLHGAAEGA